MKKRKTYLVFLTVILAALFLGACATAGSPDSTETPGGNGTPGADETPSLGFIPPEASEAVEAATKMLAGQIGVDLSSVSVVSVDKQDWPDACLGAAGPEEMCAQVITPGYLVVLEVNGARYEVRTDLTGGNVRIVPGAVGEVLKSLAAKLGVDTNMLQTLRVERMEWSDACLGVRAPKEVCAQVITPGYLVELQANGKSYVYHTDETGQKVVLAEFPLPETGSAPLVWSEIDELGCQLLVVDTNQVTFGPCEGNLTTIPFPLDLNNSDLGKFIEQFGSFEVDVAGGKLKFQGQGTETATPAQQRMIAEWARLTRQITETGRFDPEMGRVILWHREGGIAGFCDDLSLYITGMAVASSCKGNQPAGPEPIFLGAEDLEQFYEWVDGTKPFQLEQKDPATADAMTVTLEFEGQGEEEATEDVKQDLLDFTARVYQQAITGQSPQ